MNIFRYPSSRSVSIGLAVLRICAGIVFIGHGYQKMFGMGFSGVSGMFGHIGVPMPGVMGPLIAILEFFGAIGLILGFLTRPLGFLFACDMVGAILLVQWSKGFSHYELEFLLFTSGLALMFTGGGAYSVDAMIARRAPPAPTAV